MHRLFGFLFALACLTAPLGTSARTPNTAPANNYDPHAAFAPLAMPDPVNRYRSGNGAPGPDYWQNRADYVIAAKLDPANKILTGTVTITYTNNSPDALDALWLHLEQNTYRADARSVNSSARVHSQFTDGDVLDKVEVESGGAFVAAKYLVSDTRLRVQLPAALAGKGAHLRLRIAYHYTVPGSFGGRTQWLDTPNGQIYEIAQWYPRMAVYDDIRGWDPLPFLGAEFYLEYGNFDYAVTVPSDMIVAGSGALMNPNEVLTAAEKSRLAAAQASDKTVMIRTAEDVTATPPANGTKTWRFHMDQTRDVAFSASRAYLWDAARVNLPGGKTALAQSVYPVSAAGNDAWGRSTEYLKFGIEEFSRRWFPYPWPNAINVAGAVSGMEYPAVLFDSMEDKGKRLFWLTEHEIGHSYFPMIVGTDERRYQWMDEGLNTFIDIFESDAYENGVYGPKRDQEFAPGEGEPAAQIAALIADPNAPTIMTRSDAMPFTYGHPVSYFKTAFGLLMLRTDILGPERFDAAFRKFIRDWAYKHPQPSDFFRAMNSAGGEDLSYFWRGWFFNNWAFDMSVDGIGNVDDKDAAKGVQIAVTNHGQLVLPAVMRVTFTNGTTRDIAIPAETWIQAGTHNIAVGNQPIAKVVIDPEHHLPVSDRSHTTWSAP